MKAYQFALIFLVLVISVTVLCDIKSESMNTVIEKKKQIDKNLDKAIDDGVTNLVEVDSSNNVIISKHTAAEGFFASLYSSFGVLSDSISQEKLMLYIPVITVTMEEGYYIFYSDEYTGADGYTYTAKRWSEKFPYSYEDEDFIYGFTLGDTATLYDKNGLLGETGDVTRLDYHDMQTKEEYVAFRTAKPDSILLNDEAYALVRKGAIISCVEESMAYYTCRHNKIAEQNGITYNFSLPVMSEDDWAPYLDEVSMFVVFQGYPIGLGEGETYNRVASAGAKVSKNKVYYLEQKGWYLLYHDPDCPELDNNSSLLEGAGPFDSTMLANFIGCNNLTVTLANDTAITKVTGTNSYFFYDLGVIDTAAVNKVRIYAKIVGNATTSSQLYFSNKGEVEIESRSVLTTVKAGGVWQWFEFNVGSNVNWTGEVTKLRFDLIGDNTSGGSVEIREIQLLGEGTVTEGISFTSEPYYDVKSCALAGAYACPYCQEVGAYPPDYEPDY